MGFGFVEIGGVTPLPQPGNPMPRVFRLPTAQALINRMGFNSVGMHQVALNLRHRPEGLRVGINMAKNKDTPLPEALQDYQAVLDTLYPFADYFTVNISSPNTENLRQLQQSEHLQALLTPLKEQLARLNQRSGIFKPLAVKIAPDLNNEALQTLLNDCIQCGVEGIVATNTTVSRSGVEGLPHAQEKGGLSGEPLFARSTEVLALLHQYKGNRLIDLIGVGGILTPQAARAKFKAGAQAIQIYTGLIYQGPGFIRDIVSAL
jgi:dihydroorotate dehydrogenase